MNVLNYAKIILILSPSLIGCQKDEWRKLCNEITCSQSTYQINDEPCEHLGHIRDPFTNECIAKCDSPCIDGSCSFCYCTLATNEDAIKSTDPVQCKRILNGTSCQGSGCKFENLTSCGNPYVTNYFDPNECVLRCDEDSCGNGRCTKSGYCVCDSGYRPDVTNPRICLKIAAKICDECENGRHVLITRINWNRRKSWHWTRYLFMTLGIIIVGCVAVQILRVHRSRINSVL